MRIVSVLMIGSRMISVRMISVLTGYTNDRGSTVFVNGAPAPNFFFHAKPAIIPPCSATRALRAFTADTASAA